jgi:hypothetical protein
MNNYNQQNMNIPDNQLMAMANNIELNGTPINNIKYPQQNNNFDNNSMNMIIDEITNKLKNNGLLPQQPLNENNKTQKILQNELEHVNLNDGDNDYIVKKNIKKSIDKDYLTWLFNTNSFKDFIIIFVLYFLLSQNMIKDFFSQFFSGLNADEDGKVGINGVVIYGLIFAILFVAIKNLA